MPVLLLRTLGADTLGLHSAEHSTGRSPAARRPRIAAAACCMALHSCASVALPRARVFKPLSPVRLRAGRCP